MSTGRWADIIPLMKKSLSVLAVFMLLLMSLTASEYVVSTEHFDFIYSEETERSASEIICVAEECYSDLVSFFNVDPEIHIPVYFRADRKDYNAYYTAYASSHIIMYVTDNPLSLLSNAEKPLSLTFYHELTHAFTSSIKSSVVKFFSSIIGDAFVPGNLYLNQALTEGIAVYMESRYGEGRLNSPYALYLVNQIAYEKTSLQWYDITGGRDITPSGGLPYVVGGRFLEYLADKYGEDKLSSFITECALFPLFNTTGSIFRRTFGVKITDAWSDFLSSLTVTSSVREARNISGWGSWSSLLLASGEVYALDSVSSGLYEIGENTVEKLRTVSSSSTLSISSSYMLTDYVGTDERSVIVERMNGARVGKYSDYFTGVLLSDEKALLITEEDRVFRMDLVTIPEGDVVSSFSLGSDITFGQGTAISENEAVFVFSQSGKYGFLCVNTETGDVYVLTLGDELMLMSASLSDDGAIAFSYAVSSDTSSFMKYGEMRREDGTWYSRLSSDEFNGGVYSPVKNGTEVYFVSSYFSAMKVSVVDYGSLSFEEETAVEVSEFDPYTEEPSALGGKRYNPLLYMNKGLFLPFAEASGTLLGSSSGVGALYMTVDPTETHSLTFSSGWDYEASSVFLSLGYSWKSYFSTLLISTYKDGIVNAEADFTGSYRWYLSSLTRYVGVSDKVSLAYRNSDGEFLNTFSILYSDAHVAGIGRYENSGWGVKLTLENITPSLELALVIPRLLPFASTTSMSYNLPLTLRLSVTDVKSPVIAASAGVYLFTYEIQTSVPFLCMYLQNVDLRFQYSGTLATGNMSYSDMYSLSVSLGFAPLVGYLTRISMNLNAGVTYTRDGGFRFSFSFDNGVF